MSTYLGNPSLSTAVKDRVSTTFQQTLELYKQGRVDEAVSGCQLMLQMDPMFDPAKKLLQKARNPSAAIDVDKLVPESADDALAEARKALAARDFQRVVAITTEVLTNDLMNDGARILGDEAREKMEAAPFVEQFAAKCEQQLTAGNLSAARAVLEKARALDPEHPAIVRMTRAVAQRESAPAASPSFVVDNPPPPPPSPAGRGTAQASDFGFTFEEEKPAAPASSGGGFAGFSFDSPSQPAAPQKPAAPAAPGGGLGGFSFDSPSSSAPSSDAPFAGFSFDAPTTSAQPAKPSGPGDFDFSTASIETSPDDQRKIQQYLSDGDRAFQAADYQQAIDLWSRIFLIDVTNEQASERIESAKARRREIEQKVEAMLAAAIAAFDRKDTDGAREKLGEVLRLEPNNPMALDYMERLSGGRAAAVEAPYVAPEAEAFDIFADDVPAGDLPLVPPDPGEVAAPAPSKKTTGTAKAKPAPAKRTVSLPMGPILTVLAVIVLAAAGWFGWRKFMTKPAYDPVATQAIFNQAAQLAKNGKYDQAISMLQDIKPEDPQHDKALLQISDLQRKKTQASEMIDGRPAAVVYQEALANGKAASDAHDYDVAKKDFETAMRVKALPEDMKLLYEAASQQVAKLDSAKALFAERKYADALASLQPLLAADPQNKNIQRLIQDAHFNLGAVALQEEKLPDAIREFDEVLKVVPTDELARRSKELAQRYDGQSKDLLYKIYVKYLPMRAAG